MALIETASVGGCLLLAILTVITFGVRVANVDGWPAFDTYGHLYFAAELRKVKRPIRDGAVMTRYAGASAERSLRSQSGYLWNAVLGKLVEPKRLVTSQSVINPLIDAAFSPAIPLAVLALGLGTHAAVLAWGIYTFTPSNFSRFISGPRNAYWSPRLTTELTGNLFFMLLVFDFGIAQPIRWTALLALGLLTNLGGKFGQQAVLFISCALALLTASAEPFLVAVAVFALEFLLSPSRFIALSRNRAVHLSWYAKVVRKEYSPVRERTRLKPHVSRIARLQFWSFYAKASAAPLPASIALLPVVVLAIALLPLMASGSGLVQRDDVFVRGIWLIGAAALVSITTMLRPLLFLGESERYLQFVHVSAIVAFVSVIDFPLVLWLGILSIGYGACAWAAEVAHKQLIQHTRFEEEDALAAVENFLVSLPEQETVLCYPFHAFSHYRVALATQHKVVAFPFDNAVAAREYLEVCGDRYPHVSLDNWNAIAATYRPTIAISRGPDPEFMAFAERHLEEVILDAGTFRVWRVLSVPNG